MSNKIHDGAPITDERTIGVVTTVKTQVICPHCLKPASTVDHLPGMLGDMIGYALRVKEPLPTEIEVGSWMCEECGGHYYTKCSQVAGGFVYSTRKCGDAKGYRTYVLMNYKGAALLIKAWHYNHNGKEEPFDPMGNEYYYNQHTCPTNWLGVEAVIDTQQICTDPHGLFQYMGTRRVSDFFDAFVEHDVSEPSELPAEVILRVFGYEADENGNLVAFIEGEKDVGAERITPMGNTPLLSNG